MEPIESFTVDHGLDAYGNHRQVTVEGDQIVHKTSFDAEPFLRQAHEERVLTDGQRWGEGVGTKVGSIPMAVYAQALTMDTESRQKFILNWLRENPAFVTFNRFLR
jgi:hypothetical protein